MSEPVSLFFILETIGFILVAVAIGIVLVQNKKIKK